MWRADFPAVSSASSLLFDQVIMTQLGMMVALCQRSAAGQVGFERGRKREISYEVLCKRYFNLLTGWSGWAGLGTNRLCAQSTKRSSFSRMVWPISTSSPST